MIYYLTVQFQYYQIQPRQGKKYCFILIRFLINNLFKNKIQKEGGDILDKNEAIKEAKKVYDELMADEHERTLIKLREKYIRDYNTIKEDGYNNGYNDGKDAGLTQGLELGRSEGKELGAKENTIEIAKKMLKENLELELILKMTGLSKEELDKLAKELQ